MKKSKFSEHQIINILKEYESGKAFRGVNLENIKIDNSRIYPNIFETLTSIIHSKFFETT
ncbi:hypothetical protein SAMN02787073_4241 [Chryseobacterium vrystaatense]|uniref:Uncharacterized protein n=1 Tax=Chryseobacterium vrystaatense TaxID=307480 RepID=A0A1M5JLT2_9FLAO|nr:hypothetical protein SAMN02787073_4241 [Chryseobacterium vrystaatense]